MDKTGKRAIIWLRVSTKKQELESQKEELVRLALYDGWVEDQLSYIEGYGASAIKMDELYNENIEALKSKIEAGEVDTVYIWEISRLARDRTKFEEVLKALTDNKAQLVIMKPQILRLYSNDSRESVDGITKMVFDFLKNMAEQEMIIKKERFTRGREVNRAKGKWNGGANGTLFGYLVDSNNMIQPSASESKVVKLVFDLYSSGKYSVKTLAKEIEARGITFRGIVGSDSKISGILTNPAYIGKGKNSGFKAIISQELWDKVEAIRSGNDLGIRKTKESRNTYLSVKVLKCKDCGSNYIASNGKYCCYHHSKGFRFNDPCNNSDSISIEVMDKLILEAAKEAEIRLRTKYNAQSLPSLREQLVLLNDKLANIDVRVEKLEDEKKRIAYLFRKNLYTEQDVEAENGKLTYNRFQIEAERERYLYERLELEDLIDDIVSGKPVNNDDLETLTKKQQKDLVLKQISQAMISKKGNVIEVTIEAKDNTVSFYNYYYTKKKKDNQIKKLRLKTPQTLISKR